MYLHILKINKKSIIIVSYMFQPYKYVGQNIVAGDACNNNNNK